MDISFTPHAPADCVLIAHIVNQSGVPQSLEDTIQQGAKAARFKGSAGQLFEGFVEREGTVVRVALAGAGERDARTRSAHVERAGAVLAAKYLASGEKELVIDFSDADLSIEEVLAVLLGLRLRCWRHDAYRTKLADEKKVSLQKVVAVGAPAGCEEAWVDQEALAQGVEFTRLLVAQPPNVIFPVSFVEACEEAFAGTGAILKVLDDEAMAKLGMGALLGVGQGSAQPSRLLAIEWMGGDKDGEVCAFVGKGVTFDTGGISLKPPLGMEDMKWDMGGAGAVVGAMLALAKRKARANIVGVVGLVENMPDGKAQRPGDVVTTMSGQTVEILNTDAEGRLVLCDALHWVQEEYSPATVVDFATLTGAMLVALGKEYGGLFANDDGLADSLLGAGTSTGDKLWRMPLDPSYDKMIDSPIADVKNLGGRYAGSITAAQFLGRFIKNGVKWAHCDIAGMVWADKPGATWDKGATGYGVRLIERFVADHCEG